MILVISSSLNPKSKSVRLAEIAHSFYTSTVPELSLIDLRDYTLPLCNASSCYADESVQILAQKIENANGIFIASPIYNYDVNSELKTLLECTGKAWLNKVICMAVCAGGSGSYMAPMSFINSLMLDFRCLVLPQYVYATEADFDHGKLLNDKIHARLSALVSQHIALSNFWGSETTHYAET